MSPIYVYHYMMLLLNISLSCVCKCLNVFLLFSIFYCIRKFGIELNILVSCNYLLTYLFNHLIMNSLLT